MGQRCGGGQLHSGSPQSGQVVPSGQSFGGCCPGRQVAVWQNCTKLAALQPARKSLTWCSPQHTSHISTLWSRAAAHVDIILASQAEGPGAGPGGGGGGGTGGGTMPGGAWNAAAAE